MSILTSAGRRSASPDRRVRFGNIERYDIMTSNQMQQKDHVIARDKSASNLALTKLDSRIRQALQLGFAYTAGDATTYRDVVDYLLEFEIITDKRIISERQITNLIQSLYPKVVVRHSAVHSLIFVNLENRSDDIIKEELVRVTTEPVLKSYLEKASAEAHAWIKAMRESKPVILPAAENNGHKVENEDEEDEELKEIEEKSKEAKTSNKGNNNFDEVFKLNNKENDGGLSKTAANRYGSTMSLPSSSNIPTRSSSTLSLDKIPSQSKLSRKSSFNKRPASTVEHSKPSVEHDSPKKTNSNLKRNRSFTKSTDKSFVGSIRNRYASPCKLINGQEINSPIVTRKTKNPTTDTLTPQSTRRNATKPAEARSQSVMGASEVAKEQGRTRSFNQVRGGSSLELRAPSRDGHVTRTNSSSDLTRNGSSSDLRYDRTRKPSEISDIFKSSSRKAKSMDERPPAYRSNSDIRNAERDEKPVVRQGSSLSKTPSFNQATIASLNKNRQFNKPATPKIDGRRITTPNSQRKVRRTDSTRSLNKITRVRQNSLSSSETSTPSVSRESSILSREHSILSRDNSFANAGRAGSRINFKSPIKEVEEQQHKKDLVVIANAFQKAQLQNRPSATPETSVERFMVTIVKEDLEEAVGERLQLDHLYQHIRHRMILAKEELFEETQLEMSAYFDLFFRTMATHFERVGCEVAVDHVTKEKVCYLLHVKLVDYVDDLGEITNNDTYEPSESSFV